MSTVAVEGRSAARAGWRAAVRPGFAHALLGLVALALIIRVLVVVTSPHFVPRTDAADYDRIAVSLAHNGSFPASVIIPGGGPTALRPPALPIALAAVYRVVGVGSATGRWEAARLFEAALGAIAVLFVCLIALRLWGRGVAVVSGVIAAIYPPLVMVGSSLMTESLFIPLVLASVLSGLIARESTHRRRWEAVTGLLVGLTALTRADGVALVVPVAFLVWSGRPRFTRQSLYSPLIVIGVTALVLVPWTVRNQHAFNRLVPITTDGGYVLAGTYDTYAQHRTDFPALWLPPVVEQRQILARNPNLNEAQVSDRLTSKGLDYIGAHPGSLLKVGYWNTLRLLELTGTRMEKFEGWYSSYPPWLPAPSIYAFWALALLALAGLAVRRARVPPWAFWACPAVLFLSNPLFIGAARYRSPSDPFLIMLAALALIAAWERLSPRVRVGSAAA